MYKLTCALDKISWGFWNMGAYLHMHGYAIKVGAKKIHKTEYDISNMSQIKQSSEKFKYPNITN